MHPRLRTQMQGMPNGIRMPYGPKWPLEENPVEVPAQGAEGGRKDGIYY